MKNYSLKALAVIMLFITSNISAQSEDNPWQISIGMTAIDFYPVGDHEDYNQTFSGDTLRICLMLVIIGIFLLLFHIYL